jgi:hypothetical protein
MRGRNWGCARGCRPRDGELCVGIEDIQKDGSRLAFEIGYLFNRRIEYTSGLGDMNLNDAVLLRLVTRY